MSLFKNVTVKPWERKGVIGGLEPEGAFESPNEKVALSIFLVVASVVFSLFTVGYILRMELPDWRPLSEPGQLWFNTALLVISSILFNGRETLRKAMVKKTFALLFLEQVFLQYCLLWGNLSHGAACKARGTSWFQIQQTLFTIY